MEDAHQKMAQFLIPQYFERSLCAQIDAIKWESRESWHTKIIQNISGSKTYFNDMLTKLGIPTSIYIMLQPLEKLVIPMIEVQFPLKPNNYDHLPLSFLIGSFLKVFLFKLQIFFHQQSNMYQVQIFLRFLCISIYFESREQNQFPLVDYIQRYEGDIEKGMLFLQTQGPVDGFEFQNLIHEIFEQIQSRSQQFYIFMRDWCLERELEDCADQFRKKQQQLLEKVDSESISQKQVEKPIPLSQETKENQNSLNFDDAMSRSQIFFTRPVKSSIQKININTFRSEMICGPTFDLSEKKIQKRTIMSVKDKQQKYKVPKDRERKSMTRSRIQVDQKPKPIIYEEVSEKLLKYKQESQRKVWNEDVLAPPSDSD